jgi:hypothetical protein
VDFITCPFSSPADDLSDVLCLHDRGPRRRALLGRVQARRVPHHGQRQRQRVSSGLEWQE